eukprot:7827950-Pyramimonas_sp.AAC.2
MDLGKGDVVHDSEKHGRLFLQGHRGNARAAAEDHVPALGQGELLATLVVAAVPRSTALDVLQGAEGSFRAERARLAFQILQDLVLEQHVDDLA